MVIARVLKHLLTPHWLALRAFPPAVLDQIEQAVKSSERRHRGEIRFALEASLHLSSLRLATRERARQVFAQLGVWDTVENSGVLIYVQLVDRRIEIVADRGISAKVAQSEWDAICRRMEDAFKADRFQAGAVTAIGEITALLARHFPPLGENPNELPDGPVVL
jgi:uncharacterized membrane protein